MATDNVGELLSFRFHKGTIFFLTTIRFYLYVSFYFNAFRTIKHGAQRRMISVDNFFVNLRFLFFALLLLYVT